MQIQDLVIEVRNADLVRVGQLRPADLPGFTAVLRYNEVGSWTVKLPVGHPLAEELRKPGAGLIVSTEQGVLLSGPTIAVKTDQSTDDLVGTYTIQGADDSIVLSERLAYPTPTTANVAAQTSAYDVRTGNAETVMKAYVNANIGPSAPVARRIPELTIEASSNLGPTVSGSARFETLQELLKSFADLSQLGFTIEQNGNELEFQVYAPTDRSAFVRLDLDNGRLKRSEYSYNQPKTTRVIVAGQGEEELRTFIERTSTQSLEAETAWGRRIEQFKDQRGSGDLTELQQAGDEVLVNDGKTIVSVSISPSDDQTMLFGVDWNLGDKVTVVVGETELQAVVTEVGILISQDGVRIGATVGEPNSMDYETQLLTKQADAALRISSLERIK